MIIMHESAAVYKATKPVICKKCKRGKLGHIPVESEAVLSKRGKAPPDEQGEYVQVKCFVCHSYWTLTIK